LANELAKKKSITTGANHLDQLQEATDAFRKNKKFRRWWHRVYKKSQKIPRGGRHNPDLGQEAILDGYLDWLHLGKPEG